MVFLMFCCGLLILDWDLISLVVGTKSEMFMFD